ncbi:hypothetical protein M2281_005803 [Mesorhizobium soli]|nr:hypothetical protein [Mesorhizobium soli]
MRRGLSRHHFLRGALWRPPGFPGAGIVARFSPPSWFEARPAGSHLTMRHPPPGVAVAPAFLILRRREAPSRRTHLFIATPGFHRLAISKNLGRRAVGKRAHLSSICGLHDRPFDALARFVRLRIRAASRSLGPDLGAHRPAAPPLAPPARTSSPSTLIRFMTRVPAEADARDYAGGGKVGDERGCGFVCGSMISNGWRRQCREFIHKPCCDRGRQCLRRRGSFNRPAWIPGSCALRCAHAPARG